MNRLILLMLFGLSLKGISQDFFFSQSYASPMLVNPALISLNHPFEATIINRQQWASVSNKSYRTMGFSVEGNLKQLGWKELEKQKGTFRRTENTRSMGLCFYHDNAGQGRLSQDLVYLGFNQGFKLANRQYLYFGIQAGVNYLKIANPAMSYPNQFTSNGYDPTLPSNEIYQVNQRVLLDCAAGLNYCLRKPASGFSKEETKLVLGFSVYHLNRPAYYFVSNDKLNLRYNLNAMYCIDVENSNLSILPMGIFYFQGLQQNLQVGSVFRYKLSDNSKYTGINQTSYFSAGIIYRHQDAICIPVKIDYKNYSVGFNYDINVSSLSQSTRSVGAFELCLNYHASNAYLYQNKK